MHAGRARRYSRRMTQKPSSPASRIVAEHWPPTLPDHTLQRRIRSAAWETHRRFDTGEALGMNERLPRGVLAARNAQLAMKYDGFASFHAIPNDMSEKQVKGLHAQLADDALLYDRTTAVLLGEQYVQGLVLAAQSLMPQVPRISALTPAREDALRQAFSAACSAPQPYGAQPQTAQAWVSNIALHELRCDTTRVGLLQEWPALQEAASDAFIAHVRDAIEKRRAQGGVRGAA